MDTKTLYEENTDLTLQFIEADSVLHSLSITERALIKELILTCIDIAQDRPAEELRSASKLYRRREAEYQAMMQYVLTIV